MGEEDTEEMILSAIFVAVTGGLPEKYQLALIRNTNKRIIVNKSRRVGLSTTIGIKAFIYALQGKTTIITAPGLQQSREIMSKYIEPVLRAIPQQLLPPLLEDTKTIKRFATGGEIVSLANNASTVRGRSPHLIVMDEAAQFLNDTDKEMFLALEPMLLLGEQMIMVSTPFGDQNLFARVWRGEGGDTWDRIRIHWSDSPRVAALIPDLKKNYDEVSWSQEFENEFRGEVTSEFPMKLLGKCVDPDLAYETNAAADIAGVDIGRRRDFTAVYLIRRVGDVWNVVEKAVWSGVPLPEQEERLVGVSGRVGKLVFDRGGMGEQMGDSLPSRTANAIPFLFTYENKTEVWLTLKRMIEQQKIRFPHDETLLRSLNSVRRYWRLGRVIIDADRTDETGHADEATALALACYAIEKGGEIIGLADYDEGDRGQDINVPRGRW